MSIYQENYINELINNRINIEWRPKNEKNPVNRYNSSISHNHDF